MPLVNTKNMLQKALKNNYAVPAFNVCNLETAKAVIETAEELNKDAIISVSEGAISYAGLENIINIIKTLTKNTKQEFALHLDHGKSVEICKKVIDAGFTSVMFDGSNLSYEENVKLTQEIVKYAHQKNVSVEAELGKILGVEDIINSKIEHYTSPSEALDFVNKTECDSLAISIGTAHGINKGSVKPKISFNVINAVNKILPLTPLVAHGSSTVPQSLVTQINHLGGEINKSQGIPEDTIKKMSKSAICKINVDTDLRLAFTLGLRKSLVEQPDNFDPRKYLTSGINEVKKQVKNTFALMNN